jgi:branched-chain amino acid transport system permease protein
VRYFGWPLLLAGLVAPVAFGSSFVVSVAVSTLFTAFIAQAWNISGGFGGMTSFGHAMFFGTGAYVSTILQQRYGVNPWLGLVAGAGAGAAVGYGVGFLAFRAGLRGSYFALVTLAFAEVFRILANSAEITRGGLGMLIRLDQRAMNFQFADRRLWYLVAVLFCALAFGIAAWLTRSRFGAQLMAVRENEDAARALGVDVLRTKLKGLAISGALAAMGGTFYAQYYLYIDPPIAYGVEKSVEMLLAAMIGGAGTVWGPLVGAVVVHLLADTTRHFFEIPGLAPMIYGVVLVLIVGFLPQGLVSLVPRLQALARGQPRHA